MEEIRTYYDEKSRNYDETFSILYFRVFDAITWRYLEPYLPTNPKALVLDAGGGTGRWTVRIAKKARKVVLMDISEGMLKAAAQRIKQEGIVDNVVIKKGDIARTGYPDETFDLIFCEHALFLFKEPDILRGVCENPEKQSHVDNLCSQSLCCVACKVVGYAKIKRLEKRINAFAGKKTSILDTR